MTFPQEIATVQAAVQSFIRERLDAKLAKLKPEETEEKTKLEARYEADAWLADAARRVRQIQLASHTLKPLHPDARGTNLNVLPEKLLQPGVIGSDVLGDDRVDDVVGNAAALDVYKFLNLQVEGQTLLQMATQRAPAFLAALSDDKAKAEEWCGAFAGIAEGDGAPASHTLAKQVYFPLSNDSYHLLAPLFPTSLVHAVQSRMRGDRYSDDAKAARQAYRDRKPHPHGFREYPNLAIQNFGGTKPQNISQLNSERYGENWLLASLPPNWKSQEVRAPFGTTSVFDGAFGRQRYVRELVKELRHFLEKVSYNNVSIRHRRARLVEDICDEAHHYAARLRQLTPGWTQDERCSLHEAECLWLDPLRVHEDPAFLEARLKRDWVQQVSHRFGNWLNASLKSDKLAFGDAEHEQWTNELQKEMRMFRDVLEDDDDQS
jgi:CRISPR-associated protein Csy1